MQARSLTQERHGNNFLKHARRFVDATGRFPGGHEVFRGKNIGRWLLRTRVEAKGGYLSGERMQLIDDALGADTLVPVFDIAFERMLADVAEHRRLHGRLPTFNGDACHLSVWLTNCRTNANDGFLSEAHAQRLDTVLGAEWRPKFKTDKVCTHVSIPFGNLPPSTCHAGIVCKCDM